MQARRATAGLANLSGGPVAKFSILLLVLIPCVAWTEVIRKPDPAGGTGSLESMVNRGVQPWSMVQFIGLKGGKGYAKGSFSLVLYRNAPRRWFFSKGNLDLQIDGTSYPVPVLTTEQRMTGMYTVATVCALYIEPDLGEKLKTAGHVVLEIRFENRPPETWKVPEHALEEWKRVIEGASP